MKKTWQHEMCFVGCVLLAVNGFRNTFHPLELLAALAVFLSFGHAQIADRLAEKESQRDKPEVDCYKKLSYYFVGKEICWLTYFLLSQSYSALAGVFIFMAYPFWRKFYRANIKSL